MFGIILFFPLSESVFSSIMVDDSWFFMFVLVGDGSLRAVVLILWMLLCSSSNIY